MSCHFRKACLLTITLVAATALQGCQDGGSAGSTSSGGASGPPKSVSSCPSSDVFTALPVTLSDLGSYGITPLGNLNPPDHTFPSNHLYFYIKNSTGGSSVDNVPLYAPATATITNISSGTSLATNKTDYSIIFYPCTQLQAYFYHVATLSSEILSAFNSADKSCNTYNPGSGDTTHCSAGVDIPITAGEQIGTVGGPTTSSYAVDLGLYDNRITALIYANDARIRAEGNGYDDFHVVCAIDYFTATLKTQLEAALNRPANALPLCGSVDQDVANTAQGKWFEPSAGSPASAESGNIALVHSNIDPTLGIFSIGNATIGVNTPSFTPTHTGTINREFSEVTADGKIYCYDTLSTPGVIFLIQIPTSSSTTLKIEKQSANACTGAETFTSAALSFVR
ncbi:MAG: hypothetical protein COV45_00745 [Deltaproteobacteria bacterium CG11_big_fil_rev_8_21_14_0_20_47_16]|nr:MAG: hypothetical protein COV45_00745 [Deltaproteobacteria bacterium CG11_big_fil_rev_8_21_14_0_20_47_16]